MKKLILTAALILSLPAGSALAAGIDDLTMQVVNTNNSHEVMNTVELPEHANSAARDHVRHDASHDSHENATSEAQEHANEAAHEAAEAAHEAAHEAAEEANETKEQNDSSKP